jgi:hypothetical protein
LLTLPSPAREEGKYIEKNSLPLVGGVRMRVKGSGN